MQITEIRPWDPLPIDPQALAEMKREERALAAEENALADYLDDPEERRKLKVWNLKNEALGIYRQEVRERWRKRAQRTAEICGRCFAPLDPQETVYIDTIYGEFPDDGGWRREWGPVGECCVSENMKDLASFAIEHGGGVVTALDSRYSSVTTTYQTRESECHTCGRRLFPQTRRRRRYDSPVFCCGRCEDTYHNRRRARQPETKPCPMCEAEFTAKRRDAKYCSPACRQRQHRMWQSLT